MKKTNTIVNADEFSLYVKRQATLNEDTLFQSLLAACEEYDIPVEDAKQYVNEQLLNDLEGEGIRLNLIKQRSKTKRILK